MRLARVLHAASFCAAGLAGAGLVLVAGAACAADNYPVRPVRFIVSLAPGGGTDFVARVLAGRLSETWGQQVVVDNRPGAGSILGAELAAKAAPDGYTLLMGTNSLLTQPSLFKNLPYDVAKDFAPVTLALRAMLTAHPSHSRRVNAGSGKNLPQRRRDRREKQGPDHTIDAVLAFLCELCASAASNNES